MRAFSSYKMTDDGIYAKVISTTSIEIAAKAAVRLSTRHEGKPVTFDFDKFSLTVTSADVPAEVAQLYHQAQIEAAAKAAENKPAKGALNRGWQILSALTEKDDDKVLHAIMLLIESFIYEAPEISEVVSVQETREKIMDLGYLPINEIPPQVKVLARDATGITEAHRSAFAACIIGSYVANPDPRPSRLSGIFAASYFHRFGLGPTKDGVKLHLWAPAKGSLRGGPVG